MHYWYKRSQPDKKSVKCIYLTKITELEIANNMQTRLITDHSCKVWMKSTSPLKVWLRTDRQTSQK